MMHPLYPVACRYVGRQVIAHHITGRAYTGTLHSVRPDGIYLMTHGYASAEQSADGTLPVEHMIHNEEKRGKTDLVYSPVGYFAFGALTGLTLGALAGGAYGGYGYGGYGGYYW